MYSNILKYNYYILKLKNNIIYNNFDNNSKIINNIFVKLIYITNYIMNNFGRLISTVCCSCIFSDTAINLFSKRHPVTTSEEAIVIERRILTLKYPSIIIGNPHILTSRRSYNIPEALVVFFKE